MQPNSTDIEYGIEGGWCGLVDLQTTIAGFEVTLETLVEISALLKRLDERLAQLSPELPQVGNVAAGGQSLSGSFGQMLNAYQEAFNAMAAAARSAALLGLGNQPVVLNLQTNSNPAPAAPAAVAPQPTVEAQPVAAAVSAPEVTAPVAAAAAPEVIAPAAPAPAADQVVPVPKAPAPAGDLKPVGAYASQRFSTSAPGGKQIKSETDIAKPLKPIDMPSPEHQVGPIVAYGLSVVYAYGNEVRKHWPGARDSKVAVDCPIPNESWRLLNYEGTLFCVAEEKVFILSGNDIHKDAFFAGRFVAQTHTTSAWAGFQIKDGQGFVTLKDKNGKDNLGEVPVANPGDAHVFLASSNEAVYVAFSTGELFRVEGGGCQAMPKVDKGSIVGFAVDPRGLIVTSQGANGVVISLLNPTGAVLKESTAVAGSISHPPALLDHTIHLFDDSKSEAVTVSTDSLQVTIRKPIEGVVGVARLMALSEDNGVSLLLLAKDSEGRPTDVYFHGVETGLNTKLCHINAAKGDIVYADGHVAVSSTSSMQNMIQVFSVYGAASVRAAA